MKKTLISVLCLTCLLLCACSGKEIKPDVTIRADNPYMTEAIREALLNAIVHRDYSFSGSIIINVNDARMEFISIGGLLPGLSTDDIRIGISQPRNKNLAEIFHRLRLIESYGTGIRRIYKLYDNCSAQPVIEVAPNAFKMILPNMQSITLSKTLKQYLIMINIFQNLKYYLILLINIINLFYFK